MRRVTWLEYNALVIIDFHTHIFPPWIRENRDEYVKKDPCFALLYSSAKAEMVTAEELIASMDDRGVDRSVALNIGWVSQELCVETNDYILESVSHYPDRLVGFCGIQPRAGSAAVDELERCACAGARGIGEMRSDIQGFNFTDEILLRPLIDAAVKHDMILLTHSSEPVGHEYIGKGSITPDILYSLIKKFPYVKIVCAHWGGGLPFYALMPEVASACSNVFFDTAATIFLYEPQVFPQVCDIIGSGKILFGSDYPLISQDRAISQIQSLDISQRDKDKILGNNAEALLYGVVGKESGT